MKKVAWIVAGLVVLGVILQKAMHSKLEGILRDYDKALVEHRETGDHESAYYKLNRTFNRIAGAGVSVSDRPLYTSKQIGWLGKELDKRVESLLPVLEDAFPEGIENDWSSVGELRNRYRAFYQGRIAVLNRDEAARKQTELAAKLRGVASPERLPERLPEKNADQSRDDAQARSAPEKRHPAGDRHRQQQARDRAMERMKKATGTDPE